MRSLFVFLLVVPLMGNAQINRSAKELASERVGEYIVAKLFKGKTYKPGSFSDIKAVDDKKGRTAWSIAHRFEIAEKEASAGGGASKSLKPHQFMFYLDKKMTVLRAETWYSN